jgi:hypothetical protein
MAFRAFNALARALALSLLAVSLSNLSNEVR